jgi:hypothetical protein
LEVANAARQSKYLTYLTATGVVELTPRTAIVGHDGWADGQFGDYENSNIVMNDFVLIQDLAQWYDGVDAVLDKDGLSESLFAMADEAARHFEKVLEEAASKYRHVIAVTHVPPFREAAWYDGRICDDNHLPYFACKVVGEVLRRVMQSHEDCELLVLCGHTHGGGEVRLSDNLRVLTGEADYFDPVIHGPLEVE